MTENQRKILEAISKLKNELLQKYPEPDRDFAEEPVYEALGELYKFEASVLKSTIVNRLAKRTESNNVQVILEYTRFKGETPRDVADKYSINVEDLISVNDGLDSFYQKSIIKIPLVNSGEIRSQFTMIPTITSEGGEAILGTDITRTFETQNIGTEESQKIDLATYTGFTNLQQGITHRLRTQIGEVPNNKKFGLLQTELISPAEVRDSLNAISAEKTVRADKRIIEVVNISSANGNISLDLVPITGAVIKFSTASDNFTGDPERAFSLPPPPELSAPTVTFIEVYPTL